MLPWRWVVAKCEPPLHVQGIVIGPGRPVGEQVANTTALNESSASALSFFYTDFDRASMVSMVWMLYFATAHIKLR